MAEAAREDDYEETIEEDRVMEADASSDEDVASNSGRYSTQLSVEASFISMDTSTSSSTMCTSLDDVEVCLSVCVFVCVFFCLLVHLSVHLSPLYVCPFMWCVSPQYTTLAKFLMARACRSTSLASYFYW